MNKILEKLYSQKTLLEEYKDKYINSNFTDTPILPATDLMYIKESIDIIDNNINLLENDKISKLNNIDIISFLNYLENYRIKYRNRLNIDKNITFGIEIEFDNYFNLDILYEYLLNNNIYYDIYDEPSLDNGLELNSNIMTDTNKNWNSLKKVCDFLKNTTATTDKGNAGGHIHIGLQIFKNEYNYNKFLKCYMLYEDILNRFLCGEYVNIRKSASYYANLCKNNVYTYETYFKRKKAIYISDFMFDKFVEKNTIEFRRPNGTLEEVIWQNNINALIKMILTINKNDFDIDYINYKIKKDIDRIKYRSDSAYDSEINIKKVLEFVDIFYDKNIDKINFLKQYFKDYELSLQKKELIKTKKFWY